MVQEVTTQSWFSRIANAFIGIFVGIGLIIGSFALVFWNEGHSLHTAQSLAQAQKVLVSVPSSPLDSKNELQVVYLTGLATTTDVLKDDLFGVSTTAIKLNRTVEMYQWQQDTETHTESQLGGSEKEVKTYTYKQVWSQNLIDSSNFKDLANHQNPASMPLTSKMQIAQHVTVGDFNLPERLARQITGDTSIDLAKTDVAALQAKWNKPVAHDNEGLYVGASSASPAVGDLRINMTEVLPQNVSIIAQQAGRSLQAFIAPAGQSVVLLVMGQQSPQEMILQAQRENQMMTWIWRAVSLLLMMVGVGLILQPIRVLADVVPFFGSIVGFGTGLIAFAVGLMLWVVAIAIAWFAVRPLWALGLVVIAAIVCWMVLHSRKKRTTP